MGVPTPFPSAADLFDIAPLVIGRVGDAQDELVRRLSVHLPELTTLHNQERNLTGARAVPVPSAKDVLPAPNMLVDEHIGKVLVGMGTAYRDQGPGAFTTLVTVVISSIDARIENNRQIKEMWEKSEFVVLALFAYLTGCRNANGEKMWRQLIPQGVTALQGEWAREFSGTRAVFQLVQSPNMDDDED